MFSLMAQEKNKTTPFPKNECSEPNRRQARTAKREDCTVAQTEMNAARFSHATLKPWFISDTAATVIFGNARPQSMPGIEGSTRCPPWAEYRRCGVANEAPNHSGETKKPRCALNSKRYHFGVTFEKQNRLIKTAEFVRNSTCSIQL